MTCQWCEEEILEHELWPPAAPNQFHRECLLRSTLGSSAHLLGQCSCYVRGSHESDPPELTKREAAKYAAAIVEEKWNQRHRRRDADV